MTPTATGSAVPERWTPGVLEALSGNDGRLVHVILIATKPDIIKQAPLHPELVGRGELVPHGAYYITGFLNEKPLARLRADLRGMGVGRTDGNKVPEDHIASLLEVMAGLIEGGFGEARDGAGAQQAAHAFFHAHIALWAGRFFADLEKANAARLYVPVGTLGRHFVTIEEAAFEIAA